MAWPNVSPSVIADVNGTKVGIIGIMTSGALRSTLPVNVTFGQQLAPVSAATVSSLMMGFAWGVGSLLAPAVGNLGDRLGLNVALSITAVVPILAAAVAWPLPRSVSARPEVAEPAPLAAEPEA